MGSKSTRHRKTATVNIVWSNRGVPVSNDYTGTKQRVFSFVHNSTRSANLKDWKVRIARGVDASTTLYATRFTLKAAQGFWSTGYTGSWNEIAMTGQIAWSHLETPGIVGATAVTTATSAAEVAFAKNFRKKTQTWSGGVFAGELLETARLLANPARGIRKGVAELYDNMKRVVKGQKGPDPSRKVAEAVAETYLEWKFGIKPLIRDVDDAALAFRKMSVGRTFDIVRINGSGSAEVRVPSLSGLHTFNPGPALPSSSNVQIRQECFDKVEVSIRGAWRNQNPSGDMPIPMMFGVSAIDIIPTAWELVPWSFFADYFINIGDVLDAWSMRLVDFAWLNRTTRSCRTVTTSDIIVQPDTNYWFVGYGGHSKVQRFDVSRVPTTNRFDTGFKVQIPGFEKAGTWLNISALLAMKGRPNYS